jgi:hypothetical protein
MNLQTILTVLSSIFCLSPKQSEEVLVAQFSIYVDANDFKDGNVELKVGSMFDKNLWKNDCQAFYDLCLNRAVICDEEELAGIQRILDELNNKPKPKYEINKL